MRPQSKQKCAVSIIIPLYNEAATIRPLCAALNKLAARLPKSVEVIFVDDGSRDDTVARLERTALKFQREVICLSRNFGHQAALLAGLAASRGEWVISMDGDLQHPPHLIPDLIHQAKLGYDIVFTQRLDTATTHLSKRLTSQWFYQLINYFSYTPIPPAASDFRLMNRAAVTALLALPEKRKFLRGMVAWIGFKTTTVTFTVQPRVAGESKYSLRKMILLAMHGISSFSTVPLYFSAVIGFLLSCSSFLYGAYVLYIRFWVGQAVAGWSSVIFVVLVIGSVLSFLLAILGVYIAAIYDEVKARPVYIVKSQKHQLKSANSSTTRPLTRKTRP